jgi:L-proline---[L-prolyl-carrier protein] ligase
MTRPGSAFPGVGFLAAADDRSAVVEPGRGRVSYAELDRLADAVAGRIRQLGVAPGVRIGLYVHRSADAIAAMLGTLRAGCTYVPVDPFAPVERNAEIHVDCGVALSLVEVCFAEAYRDATRRLGGTIDLQQVGPVGLGRAVGEWASDGAGFGRDRPDRGTPPGSEIACIIYTSGSTGRHKGWMMSCAAIEVHARWCHELLRPDAADVFANHAQLNFGMSLFDVYASLTCGASLVLVPDQVRQFAAHVVDLLARERVTIWFSGPAILSLIAALDDLEARDLSALRAVAFAGEVFPAPPLTTLRRRLSHPRYFNFYGSTETNVAAYYELAADLELDRPPPIGRPCEHYEARVVALAGADGSAEGADQTSTSTAGDDASAASAGTHGAAACGGGSADDTGETGIGEGPGVVAGVGAAGELQLRGLGLTTGYVNQPDLTRERLVAATDGGPPWYRTGDLAIELPTGDLRYAGRIGRMVKLRGYRVEPGEIETRLHEHPEIKEVGVVPVDGPRGVQLVAHLSGKRLSTIALKEFCAVKLPAYMVPERFVFHAALPRNLRGKIDFARLRALSTE